MDQDVQVAQARQQKSWLWAYLLLSYLLCSFVFLILSSEIILWAHNYYAVLIFPLLVLVWFWRLFFRRGVASGVLQVVVIWLSATLFCLSQARLLHLLLPSNPMTISLTVDYVTLSNRGCSAGIVFKEAVGVLNDRVCGFSRAFLEGVKRGEVFVYEVQAGLLGYELIELKEIVGPLGQAAN